MQKATFQGKYMLQDLEGYRAPFREIGTATREIGTATILQLKNFNLSGELQNKVLRLHRRRLFFEMNTYSFASL
jgi:hypothetical protein